ncbi:MAG TPA: PQQ-binding-like beta-propeller repeat protein [Dehalococcoidia bacterium]|nr:PQQ-binding-like beta-propeller repeat protein [Dehalococcoidia bacterium]
MSLALAALVLALVSAGCVSAAGSRGWAPPVQTADFLLVNPGKGKIDAIDPITGDRKWRFPDHWRIEDREARKLSAVYGPPIVSGDTVFVGAYNGWVYAFKPSEASEDEDRRRPAAAFKVRGAIVGGIALDATGEYLYVTTDEGLLYAINATDLRAATEAGKNIRARFEPFHVPDRIWTPPVIAGDRVYFATTGGELYALDARNGEPVWQEPFRAAAALVSTPVVADGMVLVGGFDRRLYAVDASTGRERWRAEATDWVWTKPLVDSGTVYFADFAGKVFAVSLGSGQPVWQEPSDVGRSVRASLVLAGGSLVVATESGDLYGLEPRSGARAWGPVRLGKTLHADLLANGATVYVAPTGCVGDETGGKFYYYRVNTSTRERQSTASVC